MKNLDKKIRNYVSTVHSIVYEDQSIEEALKELRQKDIHDKILYFYVVDQEYHLVGVVSARDLLLKPQQLSIGEIMDKNVVTLQADQNLAEAMALLETQHLLALPVLDENNKFLGVIDVGHYLEESVDVANTKQRLQIFQMLGFFLDEGKKTSVWNSYKSRMPWIFCNMLGGIGCAIISRFYQDVLSKVLILAMFIPLVLSLSESISMQSMTQSLNMPSNQRLFNENPFRAVFRQWKLFVMLGVSCGVIVGSTSLLWGDGIGPAITICFGIMFSVVITALIGSMVPVLLHSKRLDPKVASGPVVLMSADILTTLIYLSLAYFLLL